MTPVNYETVESGDDAVKNTSSAHLLHSSQWPREPGVLASMNSPSVYPRTVSEWLAFVMTTRKEPWLHDFKDNLIAGATVACVNVPLSISLALASGGTPQQGMICALWSSLIMGFLGGSHFNVVGTTSALSGMMEKLANRYGADVLPTVAVYASLFLLLFWIFRLDRAMRFIPTPVAHGFSIGVAVMIAVGQLSTSFAITGLPIEDGFVPKLTQLLQNLLLADTANVVAYFVGAAALFTAALRWKRIPWVLLFAAVGILLGMALDAAGSTRLYLLREKFPVIEMRLVAAHVVLPKWLPFRSEPYACPTHHRHHGAPPCPPDPSLWQYQGDVIFYSFGCAVVSLLETLISARIANRLFKGVADDYDLLVRTYSPSRDSAALAITALACGLAGAVCPAAALARTSLNVKSGAFSRVSGILSALFLAIVAFLMMPYFIYLPFPFVGAILLLVAYRLVDFDELAILRKGDPAGFYLCVMTCLLCLCMDTFIGLIGGIAVAVLAHRKELRTLPVSICSEHHRFVDGGIHTTVQLEAAVTFANVAEADEALESVLLHLIAGGDRYYSVHLDLSRCDEVDFDGLEALDEWARKITESGAKLTVDHGIHVTRILRIAHHLRVADESKDVKPTPASEIANFSFRS
jgi:SulP family sulfate permease